MPETPRLAELDARGLHYVTGALAYILDTGRTCTDDDLRRITARAAELYGRAAS